MFRKQFSLRTLLLAVFAIACAWKAASLYDEFRPYSWSGQKYAKRYADMVYGSFGYADSPKPGFAFVSVLSPTAPEKFHSTTLSEVDFWASEESERYRKEARSAHQREKLFLVVRRGDEIVFSGEVDDRQLIAAFSNDSIKSQGSIVHRAVLEIMEHHQTGSPKPDHRAGP